MQNKNFSSNRSPHPGHTHIPLAGDEAEGGDGATSEQIAWITDRVKELHEVDEEEFWSIVRNSVDS